MSRLAAASLALALAVLAACGDATVPASSEPGPAPDRPLRIRFMDLTNMDVRDVPLLMAFDELAAQGYLVEPVYIAGNTLRVDALARGDAEMGVVNHQTAWSAIAQGADIRTVAEFTAYTGVIAAGTGIRTCRDLRERTVAIPMPTGFSALLLRLYFSTECPESSPTVVVIPESAARAAALVAGRIDATAMPGEELLKLQEQAPGRFHALTVHAQRLPGVRVDGVQVRRAWAEQHPEAVRAFLTAQLKAHRLVRANPEILYDEGARRLSLDRDTVKAVVQSHLAMNVWDANGGLTPENVQTTVDFLAASDALPGGLRAADVADLSYLQDVLEEIGRVDP